MEHKIFVPLKKFFSGVTMYRLMLYFLIILVATAVGLSVAGKLPYDPVSILVNVIYLCAVSYLSNKFFAKVFRTKENSESQFITALILSLIVGPVDPTSNILFLTFVAVIAQASKYLIAFRGRHILNPATAGVLATALILGKGASWWVGTLPMLPFVFLGGVIMIRQIRRFQLVLSFLGVYCGLLFIDSLLVGRGISVFDLLQNLILHSPLLFFSFVMLVEPLTSPTSNRPRIYYAALAAICLFSFQKWLNVPYSLELALVAGNIFFRILKPDLRMTMRLLKKEKLSNNIFSFLFEPQKKFDFIPGQFLEWTLSHEHADSRGIRRWFTISSSPTEEHIWLTTRFADKGSTFKQKLKNMTEGDEIIVSGLAGDFVLPKDLSRPMVFIAGGIGITPFRSMVKYLLDKDLTADIILLYSNRTAADAVFKEIFEEANNRFGLKTVYTVTDETPPGWQGRSGFIDQEFIKAEVPDYQKRLFYISGPEPMVESFEKMLGSMGVREENIERDYFPGYTDTQQPV
ncbi:MAG: oxidoreductase [bacterium]|nr:oxidoreductase [bacterium]